MDGQGKGRGGRADLEVNYTITGNCVSVQEGGGSGKVQAESTGR